MFEDLLQNANVLCHLFAKSNFMSGLFKVVLQSTRVFLMKSKLRRQGLIRPVSTFISYPHYKNKMGLAQGSTVKPFKKKSVFDFGKGFKY